MTAVWGVLNVTPDSFSDGGRHDDEDHALAHAAALVAAGADVIDVGGESTRPGSERIPVAEEQRRVLGVIRRLADDGVAVSIDTMNAATAAAAVAAGARYVNDVSGGLADPQILAAVAETDAVFVAGHWRGPSADMYARADYRRIGAEVAAELRERADACLAAGVDAHRIVVDPGIGFAKTAQQNWDLLRSLHEVVELGHPVLVGTSRKRFLADVLGADADEARRDLATAVTSVLAADAGAWAVRVHDVRATRDALAVRAAWQGGTHG